MGEALAYIYHTIPVENNDTIKEASTEEAPVREPAIKLVKNADTCDIDHFDWAEYLKKFCSLATVVGKRHDALTKALSEVDQEACDVLHLVELYDLTEAEDKKTMDLLKEIRQRRRDIKDEMTCLEWFQTSFGTKENITEAQNIIKQIKRLDHRVYRPRQLPELFEGVKGRETDKQLYTRVKKQEENAYTGGTEMAYVEKATIYDGQTNDWIGFAKQQLDFYQNAPQYMVNLQIALQAIDCKIEEALSTIEDANYNAAQGYNVFKELKNFRNERKELQKELDCLKVITEGVDCEKMKDLYEKKWKEIEE